MTILVFIVISLIFFILRISGDFEWTSLWMILNITFQSMLFFVLGYFLGKNYVRTGLLQLLLIGCGMISLGIGILIPAVAFLFQNLNFGWENYVVTMQLISLLIFSVFNLLAATASLSYSPYGPKRSFKKNLLLTYIIAGFLLCLFGLISILGFMPSFVIAGQYTLLQQITFLFAAILFLSSSIVFCKLYFESKSNVLYWYILAMALYIVGLLIVNQTTLGTPLAWIGRAAQYVGSVFFLIAIFTGLAKRGGSNDLENAFEHFKLKLEALFAEIKEGFAYYKILDNLPKLKSYNYIFVNNAFLKICGLNEHITSKEGLAHTWDTLNRASLKEVFDRVSSTGRHENVEKFLTERGIWISASVYSIEKEKGYVAVLLEDITERKQLEQDLKRYSEELEALVEQRTKELKDAERLATIGQTAGMIGHDIRNPLQAITGDIYLLREELGDLPKTVDVQAIKDGMDESVKAIEENVFYINKIVSDLQDYTRPLNPEIKEINLPNLISKILLDTMIPKYIIVKVNIEDPLPLRTDPEFLRRALSNIIINAYQSMQNGGKLSISAKMENEKVVISVEDTGVGIPLELQNKVFMPLFTTKAKGQGFGLAVTKRLIESLNGNITFKSEEGYGTKFTLRLPV